MRAKLGPVEIGEGLPIRIMYAINASPESFYGGSVVKSAEEAVERALSVKEHVDVVDVGGMSTAPYKETWITPEEEERRVVPIVRALSDAGFVVSVDTFRPRVAEAALRAGASIVNDISGLKLYPELCKVAREYDAGIILMARERGARIGVDPVERLAEAMRESLSTALKCGIDEEKIALDPGIGFPLLPARDEPYLIRDEYRHGDPEWPWWKWDSYVLANLRKLKMRPLVVGVSRKSFIRRIVGEGDPEKVLPGSLAAEAIAALFGADMIRTHNPKETEQAAKLAKAIREFRTPC